MTFTVNTSVTAQQTLSVDGDFGVVTQNGAISSAAPCVLMFGVDTRLINGGLIACGDDIAVFATNNVRITNTGTIVGEVLAISVSVANTSNTTTAIINEGDIIAYNGRAISMLESGATITNHGTISGNLGAITFGSSLGTAVSTLVNTGTISSGLGISSGASTVSGFGSVVIENYGLIVGRVSLGTGNDTVDNRLGEITGQISMGGGTNLFRGGDGDEDIVAGSGSDTLRGGDGDDTISGGLGADLLVGGRGADTFAFSLQGDGTFGTMDLIRGFNRKEDVIDVDALSATTFAFTGTGPLAGGGAASVGYTRSGTVLTVSVDVNGDAVADLMFQLTGTSSLTADNFVL